MNVIQEYKHFDKNVLKELTINKDGTLSLTRAGYNASAENPLDIYAKALSGTTNYAIPYQNVTTNNGVTNVVTSYLPKGTAGQVLTSKSNGYEWKSISDLDTSASNIVEVSLSAVNLTTSWSAIDNLKTRGLSDGSYLIQIIYSARTYTGVFSLVDGGTDEDEIILHMAGSQETVGTQTRGRLYAKIASTDSHSYLYLAVSQAENNASLTIKYKKLI